LKEKGINAKKGNDHHLNQGKYLRIVVAHKEAPFEFNKSPFKSTCTFLNVFTSTFLKWGVFII